MGELIFKISFAIALIAIVIAFLRLLRGPTSADRLVALDVMTIITISFIAFISCCQSRVIYLDVAMVYALVSFLGIIAIARYLEGGL
ncbi:MAG: cation:proton antiporter [Candidatus Zixiibacteriota bacterium]